MAQSTAVTREHMLRAITAATDGTAGLTPVPHMIHIVRPVPEAPPVVCLDLFDLVDAAAWADYIGLDGTLARHHKRPGVGSVSYVGTWLGWNVILTAEVPVDAEQVAAAVLTPDAAGVRS